MRRIQERSENKGFLLFCYFKTSHKPAVLLANRFYLKGASKNSINLRKQGASKNFRRAYI